MKTGILILIATLMLCISGYSQEITTDKVPAKVKQGFEAKYPAASEVKYEMQKKNYLVSFKDKEIQVSAIFNSYGRWMESHSPATETELPKKVIKAMGKEFKGYTASDIMKIEKPEKVLLYGMIMKDETHSYEVQISPKGDVVRKLPMKKEKAPKAEPEMK